MVGRILRAPLWAGLVASAAVLLAVRQTAAVAPAGGAGVCSAASRAAADPTGPPEYYTILLTPASGERGPSGSVSLSFVPSPFGIALSEEGHYVYQALVQVEGLRPAAGKHVVWATTPDLDQVVKLGILDEHLRTTGRISFNKFIVFVTVEPSADGETWSGPILLRGVSRSGLMQSMAGHSIFEQEPC